MRERVVINATRISMHWMRKAVSASDPDRLRVFARNLSAFVYSLVAQIELEAGFLSTAWIHEDGIGVERIDQPESHPVHQIVCLSDLMEVSEITAFDGLNPKTVELLDTRVIAKA